MRQGAGRLLFAVVYLCAGAAGACREDAGVAATDEAAASVAPSVDAALVANLPPGAPGDAAERGRELFLVCAPCHGPEGRGTALGPSLRDPEWTGISGSYEEIQQVIREGVPDPGAYPVPMPEGGGGVFDDDQLRSLAAYVYALSRTP